MRTNIYSLHSCGVAVLAGSIDTMADVCAPENNSISLLMPLKNLLRLFFFISLVSGCARPSPYIPTTTPAELPIIRAIKQDDAESVRQLISLDADVNAKNMWNESPVSVAISKNNLRILEILLNNGAMVNDMSYNETTPLHMAVQLGHKDIAELLLSRGADVNASGGQKGTPLHDAIDNFHARPQAKEVAELLLARGADINAVNSNGNTPLHIAAGNDDVEAVGLLIAKDANVNAANQYGVTPLQIAVKRGYKNIAELLVSSGALAGESVNINTAADHQLSILGANTATDHQAGNPDTKNAATLQAEESTSYRKFYAHLNAPLLEFGLGYRFNSHVGIEAGIYTPFSSSSDDCGVQMLASAGSGCTHEKLTTSYNQITVIGALPINVENDILIKLGMADITLDYSYSGTSCFLYLCYSNVTGSGSASKINTVYGIGWKKCPYQNLCWRVQYEDFGSIKMIRNYSNGTSDTADYSISRFMLGFIFYIR